MTSSPPVSEDRILIVAPLGADAGNLVAILGEAKLNAAACPDLSALAVEIERGCSVILLTEEAFNRSRYETLSSALNAQPPWSEIPIVMIVTGGQLAHASGEAIRLMGPRSNLTLVERPLRRATLLSTIQVAARARSRQYQIRDLLRERDELLASLEQRVEERTAKLNELNSELEAFSYSVSHDLRAPLRAIAMYAKILVQEFSTVLPEEGNGYVARIAKNALKMDNLMQDVLHLSRITRGEMTMNSIDLDELMADVLVQYPDLESARSQIEIRQPLGRVLGNVASLTQCLSNLLQNALKFVPAERAPRVQVYSETNGGRVRLFVQDNGPGIDPAQHARIFGMFERLSGSEIPGTGVGLAIVKKAITRMGGTVGVESELGQGACFWIELSAAPAEEPAVSLS
ncbi:sensor histidine kinase [Oleiharenicola lentus]|uniref:sensor histidine kinase n=1 Tax=Oleiharenicola lentus TaxID=2508720 RepID=UPI003F679155